jgi:peroxiredoxin
LGLSIVGLLATGAAGTWYYSVYRTIRFAGDALGPSSYAEWIDVEAPDFTVTDLDGNEVILSQLKGKRVILSFWATWCPPCKKEIPNLNRLRNVYDSNDLIILGISSESEETVKAFSEKRKINYTLAIEKDLPSPYSDVDSIPTTFFIDRRGIIRDILEGYNDFKHLDNHVRLLDEIDPNTNIQELLEVH